MVQKKIRNTTLKRFVLSPMYAFVRDSRSVGILLIICTLISIVITNSSWGGAGYLSFWEWPLHAPFNGVEVPHNLTAFVNDILMAVFFLLVGMEIKREMLVGELSSLKQSALPIVAALGGMIVPAVIYSLWNSGGEFAHGWGIPMATDIAFSLGILSLLGKRVPVPLKILLTALAIIDDLGAIVAIAVFYTAHISILYLSFSAGLLLLLIGFNLMKVKTIWLYWLTGIILWYCLFNSGIHATLAGVLLAFTLPLNKIPGIEHSLHFPVNFIILPLFALANTAILFPEHALKAFADPISFGVISGLVFGKPLGILVFSFLVVKLGLAKLPRGLDWKHIFGMGLIAGIGFTMSIFISMLAFNEEEARTTAKIAVLVASLISGILGYVYLKNLFKKTKKLDGLPGNQQAVVA